MSIAAPLKSAGLLLAVSLAIQAPATPQTNRSSDQGGDTVGTYVVRPGDTLEKITVRFLGEKDLWQDNWRLNPGLRDPNLLQPGQTLRIILSRTLPPRTVQVVKVARRVEKKPDPSPSWTTAAAGDLLQERDGTRTARDSSAELEFDDETRLTIGPESVVFLRKVGSSLRGIKQESIEIVEGQADLSARPERGDRVDIELIIGGARAKPKTGAAGTVETRARRGDAGDAKLMIYAGKSEVSAGGQTVQVPQGMGTNVPENGPPSPPERLLAAPQTHEPRSGSDITYRNPEFRWSEVSGAAAYILEVCADRECGALVTRQTDIARSAFQLEPLPVGDYYWRATARAASGLDGYPSRAASFSISDDPIDRSPPVVALRARGAAFVGNDGELAVSGAVELELEARDDASGVDKVEYRWDGGAWRTWSRGAVAVPSGAGEHELEVRATDGLGQESTELLRVERRQGDLAPPTVDAAPSVRVPGG